MQLSTALHYHLEDSRVEILEKENGRVTATSLFPKKLSQNKKRIFTKHPFRKAGVIFGYRFLVP
jgi:hypothetical protein